MNEARILLFKGKPKHVPSHSWAKKIAASCLEIPEDSIRLAFSPYGKPLILLPDGAHVHFNASTAQEWTAIAFNNKNAVGIDIEPINAPVDVDLFARKVLSKEEARHAGGLNKKLLVKMWTAKEAFVKALGYGLFFPLNLIETKIEDDKVILCAVHDPLIAAKEWTLIELPSWDANFTGHIVINYHRASETGEKI